MEKTISVLIVSWYISEIPNSFPTFVDSLVLVLSPGISDVHLKTFVSNQ